MPPRTSRLAGPPRAPGVPPEPDPRGHRGPRARFDRETREAEVKEDLRDAWLKDGGDPREFEAVHKKITAEAKAERLREMNDEAKEI